MQTATASSPQATNGSDLVRQIAQSALRRRAFQHSIGFFEADRESDCGSDELEFENDHEEGWF